MIRAGGTKATRSLFHPQANNMSSIEELIQQSAFKNPYQRALISLIFSTNILNTKHHDFLKDYDISPQQFNILRILRGQYPKPATVNLIRERMLDKNSDVSRIVERLRKANLVERITCEHDRRAVDIVITQKGLAVLEAIDAAQGMEGKALTVFSKTEIAQLNTLLDKLINHLSENS